MGPLQAAFVVASAGALLSGCGSRGVGNCQRVQAQENFTQSTYFTGRWYGQSQMVTRYQPIDSFYCITADYKPKSSGTFNGWTITVLNRGRFDDGRPLDAELCARDPKGDGDAAKLNVAPCFLPAFLGGDYWVLAYDAEEGYSLVVGGQPDTETDAGCYVSDTNAGMWILTRAPIPAPGLVEKVKGLAIEQGIDVSVMFDVNHSDCEYPPELTAESEATYIV